ncbi:MAG: hypothetical protein A2V46_15655 [Bacteroidetes bacterium RBG_19FT_COMBO_42_7]|nr:MAG: hypothetical protein A2Y71_01535 [Bacteroidetes bacterium RBG_13_42_15]OFY73027.1 MAG: hypothetical protein A2V46_15655 [Bacteroidetes bacterium RBG_19FT_COMBO_42_7]
MYIEEEFNGYTNKPTWTLAIWLETDESLKNYWKYKTRSLPEDELSKELQAYFEDRNPLSMEFTFYSDILTNSIKLIDWKEVAKKLKDNEREKLGLRSQVDTVANLLG